MKHIAAIVAAAAGLAAAQDNQPTWDSLRHDPPEWLLDAKLGIYTHWGVYSVPAFEGTWYPKRMHEGGQESCRHHSEAWGGPKKFPYHEFVPMFKAGNYNPAEWAKLMVASGAKYAGMAAVHHDGFLLWDSKVNRWNSMRMGPKRDCYGEYVDALRAEGLKTIATFHHIRTFNWYLPGVPGLGGAIPADRAGEIKAKDWALTDPQYNDLYWNELAGGTYEEFLEEWQAKVKEVVDKYQPDVMWFDGGRFRTEEAEKMAQRLLQYYHDRGDEWGKPVEVLNKLPVTGTFNFRRDYGILTFEEGRDRMGRVDRAWIDDMRISSVPRGGWSYVEGMPYKSANEVIDGLIDRVARGGGLLFNFSPKADGSVPEEQKEILLAMGRWLKTNGEAIYGTRPWKIAAEGDETKLWGEKWSFVDCDGSDIRFTRSKDGKMLYAIALGWPKKGKLRIGMLGEQIKVADGEIKAITLVDGNRPSKWRRNAKALFLEIPKGVGQDELAYAFRIEVDGKLDLGSIAD